MRTPDADALVRRRYGVYKSIYGLSRKEQIEAEQFWALPFDALRFRIGESYQNLKVPFTVAPALAAAVDDGLDELAVLTLLREEAIEEADASSLRMHPANGRLPSLAPISFALGDADALASKIIASSLALDPWLDAGLLRSWLGAPGKGAAMLAELYQSLRKAAREQRTPGLHEPTLFLVQLALLSHVSRVWTDKKAALAAVSIAPRLEIAASTLLFVMFEEMVRACLEAPASANSVAIDLKGEHLATTAFSPLSFLAEPDAVFLSESNPYGFSFEMYFAVNFLWRGQDPLRAELDASLDKANEQMAKEAVRVREALESAWLRDVRREIVSVLAAETDLGNEILRELARLARDPKLLRATMFSLGSKEKLLSRLQVLAGTDSRGGRFWQLSDRIAAGSLLRSNPAGAFMRAVDPIELLRDAVRAIRVYQLDKTTRRIALESSATLLERDPKKDGVDAITAEYDAGRLYRIAGDDHPLLRPQKQREEGQLFVDLKDFTRHTQRLKEASMADFLKSEFYGPMLAAAHEILEQGGLASLSLNNVLGDALSFSGDVVALLDLATRTQEILRSYRTKLQKRVPEEAVKKEMERLAKRYDAERKRIAEQRSVLKAVLADLNKRLKKAGFEPGRMTTVPSEKKTDPSFDLFGEANRATHGLFELEQREQALEHEVTWKETFLRGTELVAGIFISYGAPAAVVRISDSKFGEVKVAIAEKINEAARGTARSPDVKRRIDTIAKTAAARRGEKSIAFPFRVHIERIWSLPVPPGLTDDVRRAAEASDAEALGKAIAQVAKIAQEDVKHAKKSGVPPSAAVATHDLWNAGVALSEEALAAYQRLTQKRFHFFAKSFDVMELDDDFQKKFAFGTQRLRLVFAAQPGSDHPKHVFRWAGTMTFRGFEGRPPMTIWELLDPRDAFTTMIVERAFPTWYRVHRESGGPDGLEPVSPEADGDDEATQRTLKAPT